jgi:ubiquitin C-terminal hydrolase
MFGLRNYSGSCWVNAALQAFFRIPEVQARYDGDGDGVDSTNAIDVCLHKIWSSKGQIGLKDFFDAVRTKSMPAGVDIGDSHELFQYLCDKLPFLDELCRFRVAHSIECTACKKKSVVPDSVTEFVLDSTIGARTAATLAECIGKTVAAYTVDEWVCEACKHTGGQRQQLIGSFPKCMMFHAPLNVPIEYSSILNMNKNKYALSSVVCFNGGHWWAYGRDMPPGSSWYNLNDTHVTDHGPKQFPISPQMRLLIYYRLDE